MKARSGQATIEYAVLILILISAVIAMAVYMKRGVQGQYRGVSNEIGDQYDPKHTTSNMTMTRSSSTTTVVDATETADAFTDTTNATFNYDNTANTGTEHIDPMNAGLF